MIQQEFNRRVCVSRDHESKPRQPGWKITVAERPTLSFGWFIAHTALIQCPCDPLGLVPNRLVAETDL